MKTYEFRGQTVVIDLVPGEEQASLKCLHRCGMIIWTDSADQKVTCGCGTALLHGNKDMSEKPELVEIPKRGELAVAMKKVYPVPMRDTL